MTSKLTTTVQAVFDGEVLRPETPLALKANTRVIVTVRALPLSETQESFLDTALSLELQGPADWSENVDKYLNEARHGSNG